MLASQCRKNAASAAILLRRADATPGRPIAAIPASVEIFAILAHAAPALGAPLFPIGPKLPEPVIVELLAQAGAGVIVSGAGLQSLNMRPSGYSTGTEPGARPQSRDRNGAIAPLIATSGSSSRPLKSSVMPCALKLSTFAPMPYPSCASGPTPRPRWGCAAGYL